MKRLFYILPAIICVFALIIYFQYRERSLNARIASLEAELGKSKDECETRVAVLKAEVSDDSCSRLEGKALTDFIAQLPPRTITRFVEEFRRRSAMVRGYELPKACADMLPADCFKKRLRNGRTSGLVNGIGAVQLDQAIDEGNKPGTFGDPAE